MVPSRHTMMNIHRKMRSITIATYFQSSFTCMERTAKDTISNLFPNVPSDSLFSTFDSRYYAIGSCALLIKMPLERVLVSFSYSSNFPKAIIRNYYDDIS